MLIPCTTILTLFCDDARMDRSRPSLVLLAALAAGLSLAACSKQPTPQQDLDSLDQELTDAAKPANQADPAVTAALRDQIMVDPALTQSANTNVIRPPSRPASAAVPPDGIGARADGVAPGDLRAAPAAKGGCPACRKAQGALTLGELASRQAGGAACTANLTYSATWANRLPAGVPLYPDARVAEAAGGPACGLRVVSFASAAPVGRVLDWYYTQVTKAGYSADHQADGAQHVLGGTRGDAAYMLYVTPRSGGGSDVDLVANAGH